MEKYKIVIFIILLITILIFSCFVCNAKSLPLKGKIIYIDPGHGGNDPGANYKDIKESDINLKISYMLSNMLESNGAIVYMTRYGDYNLANIDALNIKRSDLSNRAYIINSSDSDLFISIHLNAYESSTWYGAQTFYTNNNKDNKVLALILQNNFKSKLGTTRNIKLKEDGYLYNRINKLGVLIELGFITNKKERELLINENYQYKLASIITNSIIEYYNQV